MSTRYLLFLTCLLIFGLGMFFFRKEKSTQEAVEFSSALKITSSATESEVPQLTHPPESYLKGYGSDESTPEKDLILLSYTIDAYLSIFKQPNALPILDGRSITQALAGDNSERIAFFSPKNPFINSQGELTDRWGSTIIFHPVSARLMELRSAGPDGEAYTKDDLIYPPKR